jgi:hypothetical protein
MDGDRTDNTKNDDKNEQEQEPHPSHQTRHNTQATIKLELSFALLPPPFFSRGGFQ